MDILFGFFLPDFIQDTGSRSQNIIAVERRLADQPLRAAQTAAATSFIAEVIFCVDLMDSIRVLNSFKPAIVCYALRCFLRFGKFGYKSLIKGRKFFVGFIGNSFLITDFFQNLRTIRL